MFVFEALLDQLNEGSGSGTPAPGGNLSKMLEDAQRMVDEMNNKNFTPEKKAADKERDEAKKRKIHESLMSKDLNITAHQLITLSFTYSALFSSARLHQN